MATVTVNAGHVRLKVSVMDATFVGCPSSSGFAFSLELPDAFIIDYDVPCKNVWFQFMNTIRVKEKPMSLTYISFQSTNKTTLDGTMTFHPVNKVSWSYAFGIGDCKLKYAYAHESLRTLLEPSYDVSRDMRDFATSRKFEGDDILKASYEMLKKNLKLEWSMDSKVNGMFRVAASLDLAEQ